MGNVLSKLAGCAATQLEFKSHGTFFVGALELGDVK